MPRGTSKNSKKPADKNSSGDLPLLHLANQADERLDIPTMETWLWDYCSPEDAENIETLCAGDTDAVTKIRQL